MDSKLEIGGTTFEVKKIIDIAREAGGEILKVYNDTTEAWGVSAKSDDSPVTKADIRANDLICRSLKEIYPKVPIMSEEIKNDEYSVRKDWPLYWCVDPLDGTKEFLKRNGEFTVNIALVQDNKVVMGVVYAPVLEEMYYAALGCGAYLSDTRIHAAEFSERDTGLMLVCSRSHRDERTVKFLEKFDSPETCAMGSSLKFMAVACGKAHIYPRLAPTMEWDTAASQIIVEEAGGEIFTDPEVKPMAYNKENLLNPYFIVYGKRTEQI